MPAAQLPSLATSAERAPSPSAAGRAAVAARAWSITLCASLYAAVYVLAAANGWGGAWLRQVVSALAFPPLSGTSAILLLLASRGPTLQPRVRRALALLAGGIGCVTAGELVWAWYSAVLDVEPAWSWSNAGYLLYYPFALVSFFTFPMARRVRAEWWKFALDATIVLAGLGLVLAYLMLRPQALAPRPDAAAALLDLAYPVLDMLVLLALTTLLLRRPTDPNRLAFGLLVGSQGLGIIGDVAYTLIYKQGDYRGWAWTDALYATAYVLLVAAGERYVRRPVAAVEEEGQGEPVQPFSLLPYVAIGGGYGVLTSAALEQWTEPLGTLVVGAVSLTILVVARQVLAVRENVRLLAETAARESEARFGALVRHSSDVITIVGPDHVVRFVSPAAARVLGHAPAALVGADLLHLLHPDDAPLAAAFLADAARHGGDTTPAEWRVRRPDGTWLHVETIGTNLLHEPTVGGIVLNTRDVTERKELERQLTHMAFHDPLTGLANRALFSDRVAHALDLSRRQGGRVSVLFLDLDDFKRVNDSLGHSEGDRLLAAAAERLQACVRSSDTVARLGGDEFAVLVEDPPGADGSEEVARRIHGALLTPFHLTGREVFLTVSMGIATGGAAESADDLLREADVAMYTAKGRGKGRHARYEAGMHAGVAERLELEAGLRQAAERGELALEWQPIVELEAGRPWGFEALLRWNHPRLGRLAPASFVPVAEETGVIVPIGRWVLGEALMQAQRWRGLSPADHPPHVSINLSGRQLQDPAIVDDVRAALESSGMDPALVVLEITESVLMRHTEAALDAMHALRALGVSLAVDDFGTGYSSLSYLRLFPIDILKVAKPFVDELGSARAESLARAIVALGRSLHMRTIAEGIETAEQLARLVEMECPLGQGYLISRPRPAEEIAEMLRTGSLETAEVGGG
jgi:diguanylate cyclase (GGDEF)-like protein/PAS domain S-box-containing protein